MSPQEHTNVNEIQKCLDTEIHADIASCRSFHQNVRESVRILIQDKVICISVRIIAWEARKSL